MSDILGDKAKLAGALSLENVKVTFPGGVNAFAQTVNVEVDTHAVLLPDIAGGRAMRLVAVGSVPSGAFSISGVVVHTSAVRSLVERLVDFSRVSGNVITLETAECGGGSLRVIMEYCIGRKISAMGSSAEEPYSVFAIRGVCAGIRFS